MISVFYHVYKTKGWEKTYNEQIQLLKDSGLYDAADNLYIGMTGRQPYTLNLPGKFNILYCNNKEDQYENTTINRILDLKGEHKILYFHTKGVSRHEPQFKSNIADWRRLMEYYNIEKWPDCVEKLDTYDVCGVEWYTGHINHFSGNFWWLHSRLLPRLKPLDVRIKTDAEFWFRHIEDIKAYSFFTTGLNHYDSPCSESMYR